MLPKHIFQSNMLHSSNDPAAVQIDVTQVRITVISFPPRCIELHFGYIMLEFSLKFTMNEFIL